MAVGEEDLDSNDYMQRGSVDDNATFRAVSVLTAVYQTIDHMLELRFQDKGRGYYEREIALRFPNISPASTAVAVHATSAAEADADAETSNQQRPVGVKRLWPCFALVNW